MARLRRSRPSLLHAIDPFKVPLEEAVQKAKELKKLGFPALILASTDWENFDQVISEYVESIRAAAADMPILLHFPPRKGLGLPLVKNADAAMFPFLLESSDPFFVWQSYVETFTRLAQRGDQLSDSPEMIHLAALTFGTDERSKSVMAINPVDASQEHLARLCHFIRVMGLDGAYLFSRHEAVPSSVCRYFRENMDSDRLLFASGGVRSVQRAHELFAAGADFVVFCGALECSEWRPVLQRLVQEMPVNHTS